MKTGINHLYVPGPTNVPEAVRQSMNVPMQDMRAPDYGDLTLELFTGIKKVLRRDKGNVMFFPGSGTGAWEAAITNTLNPGDKVLMARYGHFSTLWVEMAQRLDLDVEVIDIAWGAGVPVSEVSRRLGCDADDEIKAVFVTHNETATGVTSDIASVRRALDENFHDALLFVDGVSSIGSLDFQMDEWEVDLVVAGSQKGLMLPAGLGILGVSEKALEAHKTAQLKRCYYSWEDQIATNKDGYFPYTPQIPMLRALQESCNMIFEEGLENVFKRHHRIAEGVRKAILEGWELKLCAKDPYWYSDTVSAIVVPEGKDAKEVLATAFKKYHLSLGAGLTEVAGKVFRIGHLGDLNELQASAFINGAEMAMIDSGINVKPGSGIAAASEYWRKALENDAKVQNISNKEVA